MKVRQVFGVTVRWPRARFLVSRMPTNSGVGATSTHEPPWSVLWLDLRHGTPASTQLPPWLVLYDDVRQATPTSTH